MLQLKILHATAGAQHKQINIKDGKKGSSSWVKEMLETTEEASEEQTYPTLDYS